MNKHFDRHGYKRICVKYVTRNGKRIYPKKGSCLCFWVKHE